MNMPRNPIRPKAMLWLTLLLCQLSASAQEVFSFHASGLSKWGLASDQGRILQAPIYEELRRLPSGNWRGIRHEPPSVDILDAQGRVLTHHERCDIDELRAWTGSPAPGDLLTLRTWPEANERQGKSGLLDASGTMLLPPRPNGRWEALPHPGRVLWCDPLTREIVDFAQNRTVLRLEEWERLESGPFPERPVYWIHSPETAPVGRAQDESGRVLFAGNWDQLRPMANEGWLARWGAWMECLGPDGTARESVVYLSRSSPQDPWPLTVQRVPRSALATFRGDRDRGEAPPYPEGPLGWLFEDGRFQLLGTYESARQVLPGRWAATLQDGSTHWLDAQGRPLARWKHASAFAISEQPGRLLLRPDAEHPGPEAVLDTDGTVLFKAPSREELSPLGMGFRTFAKHGRIPLWITPEFKTVPLTPGLFITAVSPDHSTLVLQGRNRAHLFDPAHRRPVGKPFHWLGATLGPWVIFNRKGYMGLMHWTGREVLPAAHYEIKVWRDDRIWASRQTGDSRTQLRLLDGAGKVLHHWDNGYLIADGSHGDLRTAPGLLEVVWNQTSEQGGTRLIQEWVNLAGEVVLRCTTGMDGETPHPFSLWSRVPGE